MSSPSDPASDPAPSDPRWSFVTAFSVALSDLPSHRHGTSGRVFVAFDDVVALVHALESRRAPRPAPAPVPEEAL